jgi:hypothetical protein
MINAPKAMCALVELPLALSVIVAVFMAVQNWNDFDNVQPEAE